MTDAGTLRINIVGDNGRLNSTLADTRGKLQGFGATVSGGLNRMAGGLDRLQSALAPVTLPLAAIGATGVYVASQFQDSMAEIQARTGAVGEELAAVRTFAMDLSDTPLFSPNERAEGLLQLLSSGQSLEQAMISLPAVLDLATASGEQLGYTADVVTDTLAMYGLGVENATTVTDTFAQAAGASSADVASLAEGLANVGPVASTMGMDLGETVATLAVLSENGIKGAEAGTALRTVLRQLGAPTAETRRALSQLGVEIYNADGSMRDFSDIISDLDTVMDALPVEEQARLTQDLAGAYGAVALSALRGELSIEEMAAMMAESAGAAEVADARMGTLSGVLDGLGGSAQALAITVLTPFIDKVLTPLAAKATEVVANITDWAEKNPDLTATLVAVAAGAVALSAGAFIGSAALGAMAAAAGILLTPLAGILIALSFADWELIGTGANKVADGLTRIANGDSTGWDTVNKGITDIGLGLADIPINILNALMLGLEHITGLELPEYNWDGIIAGLRVVQDGWDLFWDNLLRGFDVFAVQSRLAVNRWIADFRQDILNVTGGKVDISPDIQMVVYDDSIKLGGMQLADAVTTALNREIATGQGIDMSTQLAINTDTISYVGSFAGLVRLFESDPFVYEQIKTGAGEGLRQALEDAIGQSMLIGDEYTLSLLTPLAVDLGVDVGQVEADVRRYIEQTRPTATVQVTVNPILNIVGDAAGKIGAWVSGITAQITAAINASIPDTGGGGASTEPGGGFVDGSHAAGLDYVPEDGYMARLHRGERVKTAAQARAEDAARSGGGGRTTIINVNSYGQSSGEMAWMVQRAMTRRGQGVLNG